MTAYRHFASQVFYDYYSGYGWRFSGTRSAHQATSDRGAQGGHKLSRCHQCRS
uniref:hypothetical protein n=1 Tax=Halomonas sp. TaxID=1486246 RepID=UPI0026323566|nr:hypothetical protein [Halomonas sp.]